MEVPDVPFEIFGPVTILLANVHDVLAVGLVSKRVRDAIPPISELTIGSEPPMRRTDGSSQRKLHWYAKFENASIPQNKLAVEYRAKDLDAHAVIRRISPEVAAGIAYLSIECCLRTEPGTRGQFHAPVMDGYRAGSAESPESWRMFCFNMELSSRRFVDWKFTILLRGSPTPTIWTTLRSRCLECVLVPL